MLLKQQRSPFDSSDFLSGADCTTYFPEVANRLATITGGPFITDGEAVVLDELGRSDFNRLHKRAMSRRWVDGLDPVIYVMFDLLVDGGRSIMEQPLEFRRGRLKELLTPPPRDTLMFSQALDGGIWLFGKALELNLEGIVAKRRDSIYRPGVRSDDWIKIKRPGAEKRFKRSSVTGETETVADVQGKKPEATADIKATAVGPPVGRAKKSPHR